MHLLGSARGLVSLLFLVSAFIGQWSFVCSDARTRLTFTFGFAACGTCLSLALVWFKIDRYLPSFCLPAALVFSARIQHPLHSSFASDMTSPEAKRKHIHAAAHLPFICCTCSAKAKALGKGQGAAAWADWQQLGLLFV
jgi:hypothetical protein